MRTVMVRSVLGVLLAGLLGSCAGQQAEAPAVDVPAITATVDSLEQAFAAAVAARDTDAVINFYADDAYFLPANAPRADGRDAIRAAWAGFLQLPGLTLALKPHQTLVSQAGDMAVDIGSYDLKTEGPRGRPVEDVGKYVTVYRKTDAGWKLVVDIFNSDRPAPAP